MTQSTQQANGKDTQEILAPKSVTLKTSDQDFESNDSHTQPRLFGRPYFQRRKACPFSGEGAPKIDYKDTRLLNRYISDYGKIIPKHVTSVSSKKQRELARAIKRARILALLPYTTR